MLAPCSVITLPGSTFADQPTGAVHKVLPHVGALLQHPVLQDDQGRTALASWPPPTRTCRSQVQVSQQVLLAVQV